MGMRLALIAAVIITVTGIKVPVNDTDEDGAQEKSVDNAESFEKPIYYESEDKEEDSYLVPPDPPLEDLSDEIATLATYLLPPSEDEPSDYYRPTEAGEQTDWYPITPAVAPLSRQLLPPKLSDKNPVSIEGYQPESIDGGFRTGKLLDDTGRQAPVPSRDLQPPLENAPNEYISNIFDEEAGIPYKNERPLGYPVRIWDGPVRPIPNNIRVNSLGKVPQTIKKHRNPTKLYPKKYTGAFKPIPIPVNQFDEFRANQNVDDENRSPSEDKTILKFEEAQKKRILKRKPEKIKVQEPITNESSEDASPLEQDTSATNYRQPLRQAYAVPLRQAPKTASTNRAQSHAPPPDGDRTEFRMHGMKGPHSYQFGFDTGKGKNRQFRYEERDNNGHVKGHYGYMDKNGKLRVVNYDADPQHGFRAEPPVDAE